MRSLFKLALIECTDEQLFILNKNDVIHEIIQQHIFLSSRPHLKISKIHKSQLKFHAFWEFFSFVFNYFS